MFKIKLTAAALGTVIWASIFSYSFAGITTPTNTTVTGSFSSYDNSLKADYHYNDIYFSVSGEQGSEQLRSLSLAMAVSAYEKDETSKGCNILDILDKTGFDSETVRKDEMDVTRTDSVGSVIASKLINGKPLISVTVRGSNYKEEWASNFDAGTSGEANGFSVSSKKLISRIKDYEQSSGLKGAKLWITGYSRGGGISDMTGKYINEHLDEFGISPDDLYIYTFEAPRACTVQTGYKNIHNVYCDMDIIPKLYPQSWGLYNAGVPEKLSVAPQEITLKTLSVMEGFKIKDTDEKMSLSEFEDKVLGWLTEKISRERFNGELKPLTDLAVYFISCPPQQQKELAAYFRSVLNGFTEHYKNSKMAILKTAGILGSGALKKSSVKYLCDTIKDIMDDNDHTKAFSEEKYEQMKEAVPTAVELLVDLMKDDMSDNGLKYIPTFASYASVIVKYHYSEQIWKAVISSDSSYDAQNGQTSPESDSSELTKAA